MNVAEKRARFRALHQGGCFLLPNPWDVGSAKRLEKMGFKALATTSSGSAWAMGKEDGELTKDEVLRHLTMICGATDLPVNADFEAGFAATPAEVAANVTAAIATGVSGLSVEDFQESRMFDLEEAEERISAAHEAIIATGEDVLLVGRSEGFIRNAPDLDATIKRLRAYSEAGADCLYAPGVTDLNAIRTLVEAVAPKPLNVLIFGDLRVADLAAAGVRRVSVGGAFARSAYKALERAAQKFKTDGVIEPR